jgi:DNA-binding CsgD family transcriptional regulator
MTLAADGERRGVALRMPVAAGERPPGRTVAVLSRVSAHLGAALCLRGAGVAGGARLGGRLADVARGAGPVDAADLWRGLMEGRWSLVRHGELDGRWVVLLRRNEAGAHDPRALCPRERQVIALAAVGWANKAIAFLLGVSAGTVSAHLASAEAKLGLGSRLDLIRFFSAAVQEQPPRCP